MDRNGCTCATRDPFATEHRDLCPQAERDKAIREMPGLTAALDEARGVAHVLAHAYDHDIHPPDYALELARKWRP